MSKRGMIAITVLAVLLVLAMQFLSNRETEAEVQQNASDAAGEAEHSPARIAVTELKRKLDAGERFLLIDVREDYELEEDGAIAGAIHIPVAELDARMPDIPKDAEIVFY